MICNVRIILIIIWAIIQIVNNQLPGVIFTIEVTVIVKCVY